MGTKTGLVQVAVLLIALFTIPDGTSQSTPPGPQPLSVHLEESGSTSSGSSSLTPDAILQSILKSLPKYFVRVSPGTPADAVVAFERKAATGDQDEQWRVQLTSKLDPKGLDSHVASLDASEIELKLELQRLYIIKNLASLDLHDAEVSLAVDGEAQPVYAKGDQFRVVFKSSADGYLNLINVRPDGKMCLLLPQDRQPLKVTADIPLYVPASGSRITVEQGPYGTEYLKAIFSTVVIDFEFLRCTAAEAAPDVDSLLAKAAAITTGARGVAGQNRVATAEIRVQTAEAAKP